MIAVICAMSEERDAFIKFLTNVKKGKLERFNYHGKDFDNVYYKGKAGKKDVVVVHCGVGKVYAAILTTLVIKKFKPKLVINVGCAGSLNKNVHVGDVVAATRIADWDVDVPGWPRSITSNKMSFACDKKFINSIPKNNEVNIIKGHIVSGDEFVYNKTQIKTIKKYFKSALCCEMEGSSIANTCYAFDIPVAIVRSISDEALVSNSFKNFDINLSLAAYNAALLCVKIIKRY